ncbi:MAG: ATP-dependent helicase HrpB [Ignavibacteriales bacterium]|nr:ATP-dependent helicase HrpB [Ignavibacteriales bacterium]
MSQSNSHLPVEDVVPELIKALAGSRCVVLSAPPGAGKTTHIPLTLFDTPWLEGKKILMLEPRRLAARRAAEYMAQQLGEGVGRTVGYRIRGDAVVSDDTRLEVVTEGILTRMLHAHPDLPGVGLVIFDEFHERSIYADLGLAFALDVQKHLREDLRLLVMSATLDGVAVASLLGDAPVIESHGAAFPVETKYARFSAEKPLEIRVADVVSRALAANEGDVLVFLPGMREIRRTEEDLWKKLSDDEVVHVLHGDLPRSVQDLALTPDKEGKRKVILSTSIAETSLTIDGVRIVVDSGFVRTARFDQRRGMSGLVTIPVSRAVADQRRGRAGRQSAGICYRLWTEPEHAQLPDYPVPEIRVADLAHVALDFASWGTPTGEGLLFLDPPPAAHLAYAQEVLRRLGAMTDDGRLTPHGRAMAALPIHPRLAHMIIKGEQLGFGASACELAAVLEERDSLLSGTNKDVDLTARIDAVRKSNSRKTGVSERVTSQTRRLMEMIGAINVDKGGDAVGLLLALAYPERIARKRPGRSGSYQLSGGGVAALPAGSLLARSEYLAIADLDAGSETARIYLATTVRQNELESAFASEIVVEKEIEWSASEKRVKARHLRKLGDVILREEPLELEGEEVVKVLAEGVRRAGLRCLPWDKDAEHFRARVQWARGLMAELPDLSDEALEASIAEWLGPFLEGMWTLQHLQRLRLAEILRSRLSQHDLREIERLAPSHLQVPTGSRIAVEYSASGQPALSVKLQELFGLTETPRVGGGTTPVTIHLLSPAGRPLAVTQDLHSFWQNTYPEIRKQLRARYPKHPWPENPLTATPTRRTIRKR